MLAVESWRFSMLGIRRRSSMVGKYRDDIFWFIMQCRVVIYYGHGRVVIEAGFVCCITFIG